MALINLTTSTVVSSLPDVTAAILTNFNNVASTNTTLVIYSYNQSFMKMNESTLSGRAAYIYPGPVICLFGMVCNVLNLCVLTQPQLSDSPYTYLTALAFADLGMLTISFIHLVNFGPARSYANSFYDAYIFFGVGNIFFNCSVWFTVLLTIERMLFVIRPLHTRSSIKRARIRIFIVVGVCSVINIPRFLCFEVKKKEGTSIYYPKGTQFRKSLFFYQTSLCQAIIINFIPVMILTVANCILIFAVRRARKMRELYQMHSNQERVWRRDQAKLTKTLISIIILFIVCTLPSAFAEDPIAYNLFARDMPWDEFLSSVNNETFIYISNLLLFLNSSLNFVLYCAFNDKFRSAMKNIFIKVRSKCKGARVDKSTALYTKRVFSYKNNETLRTHV